MYRQESADQEARVEKMKANGEDEYDIKKQIEVLKDTEQMVPVMRKKIDEMKASLEAILVSMRECGGKGGVAVAKLHV